jgi:hypothetical protein
MKQSLTENLSIFNQKSRSLMLGSITIQDMSNKHKIENKSA